jgi:hypothetical protein
MREKKIRDELVKVVDGQNGWESLLQLMLKLKKEDSEIVLDALLNIFFFDNRRYHTAAGGLLWKLKPKYKRNLRRDIKLSLKNWDVSIEELPWYFAEVVGIESVRSEVKLLLEEPLEDSERGLAETTFIGFP